MQSKYDLENLDKSVNVHEGCTLLPFTTILVPDRRKPNQSDVAVNIRYTIKSLLEIEQLLRKSLWIILDQGLAGLIGEEDKATILSLGVESPDLLRVLLDELSLREAQRIYLTSQLEITRALGYEVTYDDNGIPIKVGPRAIESYKKASVQDTESFSQKVKEPTSFAQWYETALKELFKTGVVMPIDELLSLMPIELETYFTAHEARNVYNVQLATFTAWRTADFIGGVMNGKKLPNLPPLLRSIEVGANRATSSKYAREEAQKVIDQNRRDRAAMDERLQQQKQQAKQSET
jgi:hypothetical protein